MTKNKLLMRVGHKIKTLRQARKIAQQGLAAACNFEKSNMSRIEAGRNNLTLGTLLTIGNALQVEIRDIVDIQ